MLNLEAIDLKENEYILMTFDEILVCAKDNEFTLAMYYKRKNTFISRC